LTKKIEDCILVLIQGDLFQMVHGLSRLASSLKSLSSCGG
jgi:hypothetical protein